MLFSIIPMCVCVLNYLKKQNSENLKKQKKNESFNEPAPCWNFSSCNERSRSTTLVWWKWPFQIINKKNFIILFLLKVLFGLEKYYFVFGLWKLLLLSGILNQNWENSMKKIISKKISFFNSDNNWKKSKRRKLPGKWEYFPENLIILILFALLIRTLINFWDKRGYFNKFQVSSTHYPFLLF